MSKNIIVTGGAGFVGSNLALELQKRDLEAKITVIDDLSNGDLNNLSKFNGEIITEDINYLNLEKHFDNVDEIFHQAAITDTTIMNYNTMMKANTDAFRKILDFSLKKEAKLVYASSAAVYGNSPAPMKVGSGEEPTNVYGLSKLACDNLTRTLLEKNPETSIVGLRYFNVYGPREEYKGKMSSMVWQLYNQIKKEENPRIFKNGEQKRDFIYVKDIVNANLLALGGPSGVYNVGSGKAETFNKIIEILNKRLNSKKKTDYFDNPYDFYQGHTCANLEDSKKMGYEPKFNLESGINDYVDYIEKNE